MSDDDEFRKREREMGEHLYREAQRSSEREAQNTDRWREHKKSERERRAREDQQKRNRRGPGPRRRR